MIVNENGSIECRFGSLPPSQGPGKAHAFDTNGVLYYIGTDGGTKAYENPHTSGKVVAAARWWWQGGSRRQRGGGKVAAAARWQ